MGNRILFPLVALFRSNIPIIITRTLEKFGLRSFTLATKPIII